MKISEMLLRLKRVKNIGLISALLVLGVLLCTFEAVPLQSGAGETRLEEKIERLCIELAGDGVYVSVNTDVAGELVGIALILNKEENAKLKLELTEMLSTLYGIPSSRIYVGAK
ncbi:MAG: hypothetical protein J6V93_02775 [Clostridia bacterium]|nr:hypothetical protein [Clostridia bacterium]